jgi:hypothetical protein
LRAGSRMPMSTAIIPMTTSNSTKRESVAAIERGASRLPELACKLSNAAVQSNLRESR